MTKDEILKLKGRRLDAAVAEKVMGMERWLNCFEYTYRVWTDPKPYSTDIRAAFEVVKKLREMWTKATEGVDGLAEFDPPFDDKVFFDYLARRADRRWPWAMLYITPADICRAALLAVTGENQP